MSINIIILLVVLIVFTIGFMYIEPMMAKHKIKSDNEYGSARFSSKSEIEKYFVKERIGHIREAGVPILFSKDLKYMWVDKETPHYVYLGSTGSGKSVTAVIPFCSFIATAKNKRSVFITDPKGEIYNTTSSMFKNLSLASNLPFSKYSTSNPVCNFLLRSSLNIGTNLKPVT